VHHDTGAAQEEALKRRKMRQKEDHILALEIASLEAAAQATVAATEFKHDITGIYRGALKNQVQHLWERMLHGKNLQSVEY